MKHQNIRTLNEILADLDKIREPIPQSFGNERERDRAFVRRIDKESSLLLELERTLRAQARLADEIISEIIEEGKEGN